MTERKKRCRYQVWERGRGMNAYQCFSAAKTERELWLRPLKDRPEHAELLPVCGTHANAVDRDPRLRVHSAYEPRRDDMWHAKVEEYK